MQCLTPMFREYEISQNKTIRIVPRQEVMEGLAMNHDSIRIQLDKRNKVLLAHNRLIQTIPCGHCIACKMTKSAEWATRCTLETLEAEENYFVTLTYDDEFLPIATEMEYNNQIYINIGDEEWSKGTLLPDDVTKFLKKLRNYFYYHNKFTGMRYFYAGEYGTQNGRPHYHLLLFNCPLGLDNIYDITVKDFKEHWKDRLLDECWDNKGLIDVANVEWSSAAYVARYTTKKMYESPSDANYYLNGHLPEFVRMSRKPGIGMKYYHENKLKIYDNDEMIMKTVKGNVGSIKPPKAFDKLFKEEYPEQWKEIEKKRKRAAEINRHKSYYLSNYSDLENLETRNSKISAKANMLAREL